VYARDRSSLPLCLRLSSVSPLQVVAPLIASGYFSVAEVAPLLDGFVASKLGGAFGALLLAHASKLARAGGEAKAAAHAAILEAARSHTVSLVALCVPGRMALKKAADSLAVAGEDAGALQAAYPELVALADISNKVTAAVRNAGEVGALSAAVDALPEGARSGRDFARGLVSEAVAAAVQEAANGGADVKSTLASLASVLRPVVAAAGADAGVHVMNGAQVAVALSLARAAEEGEDTQPRLYSDVAAALGGDEPILPAAAVKAWGTEGPTIADGGVATAYGRAAAVAAVADLVASL